MHAELHLVIALALSAGIGVSLGLLGGGGSILAMPVLVYVAGIAPASAVGMSLAIVGTTSLLTALLHRRSGNVDLRVAASFSATGIVGALLGARLTHLVSDQALLLSFAGLMLVVGGWMLLGVGDRVAKGSTAADPTDARQAWWITVLVGGLIGALTGFLGVGGGFLIVPALVLLTGMPMKRAVGTSLLVIAVNSAAGLVGHLGEDAIDLGQTAAFTVMALLGAVVGHRLASRWSATRLRRSFAGLVMVVGGVVAAQTLAAIG